MKYKIDESERGKEYGVIHYDADANSNLSSFFTNEKIHVEFESLLKLGAIYINNVRAQIDSPVLVGDRIRIHSQPRRFLKPELLEKRIIFENDSFVIIDKPAGLPVHGLVDNLKENLISFLESELGYRLFITHRLDIETSGLFLIAKNLKTQSHINSLFATKQIQRKYQAFTERILTPGSYVHFMKPSPTAPKIVSHFFIEGYQRCEMIIHSSKKDKIEKIRTYWDCDLATSFVSEIELLTGRTQQIRSQLAHLSEPILGDSKYNSEIIVRSKDSNRPVIALRSFYLDLRALNINCPIQI